MSGEIKVSKEAAYQFIRELLIIQPFDERWYLTTYPDVKRAIALGQVKSARDHYIYTGYFEGRLPGLYGFNVDSYLHHNPDLQHLSKAQALQHFITSGYHEGRRY